jgi:FKBP-type peptidyl-prolyl cis-trans isomerase SlyD
MGYCYELGTAVNCYSGGDSGETKEIMSITTAQKNTAVKIRFTLHDPDGQLIDEEADGITYLHGGYDEIFPLVEAAFDNKPVGHRIDVLLTPENAFGEYDEENIRTEKVEDLDMPDLEVGTILESEDDETGEPVYWQVIEIKGDEVALDANHPLAGLTIRFQGEIVEIREATPTEIEHGHVHDGDEDEEE